MIPVHLDRIWGSIFSFIGGRFMTKRPERVPYPVTVSYGQPMPSTATAAEVRQRVQELGEEAWRYRKSDRRLLHHSLFVRLAAIRFVLPLPTRPGPESRAWNRSPAPLRWPGRSARTG